VQTPIEILFRTNFFYINQLCLPFGHGGWPVEHLSLIEQLRFSKLENVLLQNKKIEIKIE